MGVKGVTVIEAGMDEGSGYCGNGCGIDSVECDENREYGNDSRCRGMKSVWRKTVSSQI